MEEYSERNWPLSDMIDEFPDDRNEITTEMLAANECDDCRPPLDIGPPPPLLASFQAFVNSAKNCNICYMLSEVEQSAQSPHMSLSEDLLFSIYVAVVIISSCVLIFAALIVLLVNIKKCREFFQSCVSREVPKELSSTH